MLTRWDALLVNACAAFLVEAAPSADERARDLEAIRAALPHASRGVPRVARLAEAAARLEAAAPLRRHDGAKWARVCLTAGAALADLLRWRSAELLAQLAEDA